MEVSKYGSPTNNKKISFALIIIYILTFYYLTASQSNVLSNADEITNATTVAPATSVAPTTTTPMSNIPPGPPEPRFNYMDLNVSSVSNLTPHITINSQVI